MFKLNNVGKKLYFSVLAVFLVFAVTAPLYGAALHALAPSPL